MQHCASLQPASFDVLHRLSTLHDLGRTNGVALLHQASATCLHARLNDDGEAITTHVAFDGVLPRRARARLYQLGQQVRFGRGQISLDQSDCVVRVPGALSAPGLQAAQLGVALFGLIRQLL